MSTIKGFVRSTFLERGFCFLRDHLTSSDVFAHRSEFKFDPILIIKNVDVTYDVVEFVKDGKPMKKAINIKLYVPESAPKKKREPVDHFPEAIPEGPVSQAVMDVLAQPTEPRPKVDSAAIQKILADDGQTDANGGE